MKPSGKEVRKLTVRSVCSKMQENENFYIDRNHTSFEKKNNFSSKTQILYPSRNPPVSESHSTDRNFKT